jgi:hypothetical protein
MYDNYPTITVHAPFYSEAVHWRKPKAGHTRAERDQQNADARLIAASPRMYDYIAKRAEFGDIEAREILETINAE